MRITTPMLLLLAMLLLATPASAQLKNKTNRLAARLASSSINPASDSVAIMHMRAKMDSIRRHRPTVALVLAGGGATGAAHVGALKYIEELGIPIDMVLGTSMGGLVGGLVAMGYPAATIDSIMRHTDWNIMLSDRVPKEYIPYLSRLFNDKYFLRIPFYYENEEWERRSRESTLTHPTDQFDKSSAEITQDVQKNAIANLPDGYLYGYNVNNIINSLTVGYQDSMDFWNLPIPFCCVATDLVDMKARYWTTGRLPEAMRATMSIPFYFTPVRTGGRVFIDGGTRNNFPTDMARAMGADYVIGIDLSQPRGYNDINGLASLLMQCINLMGKDAFDHNLKLTDVYIHPDMTGMNMLSFDTKSIAECLHRGYVAAQNQQEGLRLIRNHMGDSLTKPLARKTATNLNVDKVLVGRIVYDGIDSLMAQYFANRCQLEPGTRYDKYDIEDEMATMLSTNVFDQVSYTLQGTSEPYTLVFHCKQGPIHQFASGLHFDSKTNITAALHVGLFKHHPQGFKADFTTWIGNNPAATADLTYTFLKGPAIGLKLHSRYQTLKQYSAQQTLISDIMQNYTLWHNSAELYLLAHSWTNSYAKGGIRYDVTPFKRKSTFFHFSDMPTDTNTNSDTKKSNTRIDLQDGLQTTTSNDWSTYEISAFAEYAYDNTDDSYFPTKGIHAKIHYELVKYNEFYDDFDMTLNFLCHQLNLAAKGVVRLGNRWVLIPSAYVHINLDAKSKNIISGNTSNWLQCYIGGTSAGRFYPNQLPYIGYNLPHMTFLGLGYAVANIDLRWQATPKSYLTLTLASHGSLVTLDKDLEDAQNTSSDYAFAIQYGYKSVIGPINFNIHWSRHNEPSPWGCYLSVGFEL